MAANPAHSQSFDAGPSLDGIGDVRRQKTSQSLERRSRSAAPVPIVAFVVCSMAVAACDPIYNPFVDAYVVGVAVELPGQDYEALTDVPMPVRLNEYTWRIDGRDKNAYDETVRVARLAAADDKCEPLARHYRKRLQDHIVDVSDGVCSRHKATIIANAATVNFASSLTATVLAGTATLTTGSAARALSAGAASASALSAHANASFYRDLLATAIVKEIEKSRRIEREALDKRNARSVIDYPVEAALRDAQVYHNKCSFYWGLTQLTKDKTTREVLSQSQIDNEIKKLGDENARFAVDLGELKKQIEQKKAEIKTLEKGNDKDKDEKIDDLNKDKQRLEDRKRDLEEIYQLNLLRSDELRMKRTTAPGVSRDWNIEERKDDPAPVVRAEPETRHVEKPGLQCKKAKADRAKAEQQSPPQSKNGDARKRKVVDRTKRPGEGGEG